ncbi:MAG: NAD-dependent epimerase/dehydratase family protein [Candidatus Hodarchaeota archaeon]
MEVLVTGANGFIGSHLCSRLVNRGDAVKAFVLEKTSTDFMLSLIEGHQDKLQIVEGNVLDIDSIRKAVTGVDAVVHLAGVIKAKRKEVFDSVNVQGSVNVCQALVGENPGVGSVIMTSSSTMMGPAPLSCPATEDREPNVLHDDFYAESKLSMERSIEPFYDLLPISIVRPPGVFGPGDMPSLDIYKFAKRGLKLLIGKEPRHFSIVDVRDLCSGICAMMANPKAVGEAFFFATGDIMDWDSFQELIGRVVFGKTKPLRKFRVSEKTAIRFGAFMGFLGKLFGKVPFLTKAKMTELASEGWCVDCSKARNLLGWKPEQTIESLIRDAGSWYREHGYL